MFMSIFVSQALWNFFISAVSGKADMGSMYRLTTQSGSGIKCLFSDNNTTTNCRMQIGDLGYA